MNLEQLVDQLELVTDTDEGFEQLRKVILEQAFRGSLTKRNSENEDAIKLLQRIDVEKQRLYDEGEIRKPKSPDEVSSDETPNKIPNGWIWTNVQNLFFTISTSGNKIKKRDFLEEGEFPIIDQGQEYIGGFTNEEDKLIDIPRDVVIFGDHTREVKYINFNFVAGADGIKVFCPVLINAKYFYWLLNSVELTDRGYARHFKLLKQKAVPLPPLEEQQRIVRNIETLFSQVDELEQKVQQDRQVDERLQVAVLDDLQHAETPEASKKSWQRLTNHFEQIYHKPEHIDQLKQAILNEAARGRLVSQDPSDEPAEKLLERIKEEKQRLYDEGEIRKPKELPEITDEEIPYELQEDWEWCRLGNVVQIHSSKRIYKKEYVNEGIPFFRSKEIGELGKGTYEESEYYISESRFKELKEQVGVPDDGDLLVTSVGSLGNTWISDGRDFYYKDGNVTQIVNHDKINIEYTEKFIRSPLFQLQVKKAVSGTAYSALTIIKFKKMLIPIPPLEEQKRIVKKIDELFTWCDDLKSTLSRSRQTDQRLLEALVNGRE